jgi:imidazole glycerol-phosphate synthase subunit HisH
MGWNDVEPAAPHALPEAFPAPCYFAHSYAVQDAAARCLLASTTVEHGGFASLVGEGRVAGAQFHPERSGAAGAEFLRAVLRWAGDAA